MLSCYWLMLFNKLPGRYPTPSLAQQPLMGQGLLIIEASRSYSDTPHPIGHPQTSNQPDAKTSIWTHTTLARNRNPCPQRDSNPQPQQANTVVYIGLCITQQNWQTISRLRSIRKIYVHFEYLENWSRDVTWQPVRGDLTAHAWTVTLPWGSN
jgi:hypothetical protein